MEYQPPVTGHVKHGFHPGHWLWLSVVSLALIWYAILSLGVYSGLWSGTKTIAVLRITPLPVAFIGWHPLSYADFLDQRRAIIRHQDSAQRMNTLPQSTMSKDFSGAVALTKMIRTAENRRLLKIYGVSVTSTDIEQAFQAQMLQNGNADEVKRLIENMYGWTPEQFKRYAIAPSVMQDKLQQKLSFDTTISAAAKTKIEQLATLLRQSPNDFSDVAKQFSRDVYSASGGDAGLVTQGEIVKAFDDVAFNLELNHLSEVIHTEFGYSLLKVTERKTVDGRNQVHLWQITILAPQVEQTLADGLKKSRVMILTGGLRWDRSITQVTTKNLPALL